MFDLVYQEKEAYLVKHCRTENVFIAGSNDSIFLKKRCLSHQGSKGLAPKLFNHVYLKNEQTFWISVRNENNSISETFRLKSRKRSAGP